MKRRAVLVVGLIACGSKEPPPAPVSNVVIVPDAGPVDAPMTEVEQAIATMSGFADDMCKCVDKACADAVQDRMTKWSTEMAKNPRERDRKPDEVVMKKMVEIGTKYGECMTKAMSATTP